MATSSSTSNLDFEALLSRDYKPSLVTRLIPSEKFRPEKLNKQHHHHAEKKTLSSSRKTNTYRRIDPETSRLVFSLVSQTPNYTRHLDAQNPAAPFFQGEIKKALQWLSEPIPPKNTVYSTANVIEPAFHEVELGDWESKINWEGTPATESSSSSDIVPVKNPMELLEQKRNPHLDNISFDNVDDAKLIFARASQAPLILELGVAGRSVAKQVYSNTVLTAQRPVPALQSEAYRNRMERDWARSNAGESGVTSKSLHADKDQQEKVIEERQKKRAQMEVDKTNRVSEAMGTMALGGGRGRTVTSSLMGPGGTERTGRPSRALHSVHEAEYIEQLEMINNHALLKSDYPKVVQRQYMRPKLPRSIVNPNLTWQFQIRLVATNNKTDSQAQSSSYQAIMMGAHHPGAISKERLRTEADLTPTEGNLVLLEYVEERPPIQLSKGMCSKIINYYRGDKTRCPVSAGGGDRPARRKRGTDTTADRESSNSGKNNDRLTRLEGPNLQTNVMDWVGKLPKKTQTDRSEAEAIDVLPEGVTEILHPKVHGPFIGPIEEGETITSLISNLFVAPMFRHEPESTDFLMILTPPGGASRPGQRDAMGVILREIPSSVYTVGQTEPRTRVNAPNTQGEKNFLGQFLSYQIARTLNRAFNRNGDGLRYDELDARVLPSLDLPKGALRQRLKQVAVYEDSIWTPKKIGFEDYPGVDALGKQISPESIAAFESGVAASRRLIDLGIQQLLEKGSHTVLSVGATIVYLAGQLNAARELAKKLKKLGDISKTNKSANAMQIKLYEKASEELDTMFKSLRQRHEVAQFIYEELQLAPWHLTSEFIDVHKKGEGSGMMKLTGLGDPSGRGEGFSFLRETETKASKNTGGALNADIKKITGTEADLRKMTMKQMAALLRSYNMPQKKIDTLKRWDRVHVIRELSTRAASDGIGDGLERFARGEKMKLSEQKKMYAERIKVIWKRQLAALSVSGDRTMEVTGADTNITGEDSEAVTQPGQESLHKKATESSSKVDSDSDSDDDDDLAADLVNEMMDTSTVNQLVSSHARVGEREVGLGQLRAAAQNQDLTKDARAFAALKRQHDEERKAQEGLSSMATGTDAYTISGLVPNQKVIRKRITKTNADGRQTTTFKFILHPEEVGKIMARLQQSGGNERPKSRVVKYEFNPDERPPGHAMFEDDDDFEYSSTGRLHSGRRRGAVSRRGRGTGRVARNLQYGKLKTKISKEERARKLKREEEEMEVYASSHKRKGTNNRRERGSIRGRMPHVIFAEKLEAIRSSVESRPSAGPFLRPVNPKIIPRYYEVISHPIDLSAIREKIAKYEYRTTDNMLSDFELMKKNAIKFNGPDSPFSLEACAIYDFVRDHLEANRHEFAALEEATNEIMEAAKPKKKRKMAGKTKKKSSASVASSANFSVDFTDSMFNDSGSDDSL